MLKEQFLRRPAIMKEQLENTELERRWLKSIWALNISSLPCFLQQWTALDSELKLCLIILKLSNILKESWSPPTILPLKRNLNLLRPKLITLAERRMLMRWSKEKSHTELNLRTLKDYSSLSAIPGRRCIAIMESITEEVDQLRVALLT